MNEKLLSSFFRTYLNKKNIRYLEQVSFRFKRIDFVLFDDGEIISIELKVFNWQSAFHQASQNLIFSNKSYIAIWHKFKHRVNIDLIKKYNIGLITIKKNKLHESYKPKGLNNYLEQKYYSLYKKRILIKNNEVLSRN